MYIKVNNGIIEKYPYSIGELRRDNPKTSFPKNPSIDLLAEFGVFPVESTSYPAIDHTKNIKEGTPVNNNGWKQTWVVEDASAGEIAERTADRAKSVRAERDQNLAKTDWRFRSDMNPSQAWVDYCQALRDIPQQAGFPYNVTWPTKPE